MRILDKNTDFYDYLQGVYRDDTVVFDRRSSFVLSKEDLSHKLFVPDRYTREVSDAYLLMQVCNTFWLFKGVPTGKRENSYGGYDYDYSIRQLTSWKNYNLKRELFRLNVIAPGYHTLWFLRNNDEDASLLMNDINTGNYRERLDLCKGNVWKGNVAEERRFPILKETGIAGCVNPLDVYLAFDEYFSAEKTAAERTESLNITDKEKVVNHGFDVKTSFRGKKNKEKER